MGFEDNFLSGIDNRRRNERKEKARELRGGIELPPIITRAHERLQQEVFKSREYMVFATDFVDVYGEDKVKADMLEVLRLRKIFEATNTKEMKKAKELAEVFEGLILVNAKNNKWFGEADVYKTSLYDDYKNKTDMYGEWYTRESGSRVLALAVDLTFSQGKSAGKLDDIKKDIDAGRLREIRYFKDARGNFKGTHFNVPRIILGVGTRELADMAHLWMAGKDDRLANHPVRSLLIKEMYVQADTIRSYARSIGQTTVEEAYDRVLHVIEPLYLQIEKGPSLAEHEEDPVLKAIKEKMEVFRRPR